MSNDEKKVWTTEQIAPCPHRKDHAWILQKLQGHFYTDDPSKFFPATKHKTRVLYVEMDEFGKITNVNRD